MSFWAIIAMIARIAGFIEWAEKIYPSIPKPSPLVPDLTLIQHENPELSNPPDKGGLPL